MYQCICIILQLYWRKKRERERSLILCSSEQNVGSNVTLALGKVRFQVCWTPLFEFNSYIFSQDFTGRFLLTGVYWHILPNVQNKIMSWKCFELLLCVQQSWEMTSWVKHIKTVIVDRRGKCGKRLGHIFCVCCDSAWCSVPNIVCKLTVFCMIIVYICELYWCDN